ncbi:MAG: DUF817 family protein [Bacteroidales bacterium]
MTLYDRVEAAILPWGGRVLAEGAADLLAFGVKEATACLFAAAFLALLALSRHVEVPGLARYDLLFVGALAIQAALVASGRESPRDVALLSLFHVIGLGLELFKTSPAIHSWSYPEAASLRIGTVPLYSGFMYAAVASYTLQAWRLLRLRLEGFPPLPVAAALAALVYANFFTSHFIGDLRWPLAAAVVVAFWRTRLHFTPRRREWCLPMPLAFLLVGLFIWIAENIATLFGAWVYPHQVHGWSPVGLAKVGSWTLLVIVSVVIVATAQMQRKDAR